MARKRKIHIKDSPPFHKKRTMCGYYLMDHPTLPVQGTETEKLGQDVCKTCQSISNIRSSMPPW